jgi:purine nucleosidase
LNFFFLKGVDDAMAILFALASPELDVIGLTIVHGNNGNVDLLARNARIILELANRPEVPVFIGASKALHFPHCGGATFVHGNNALGDIALSEPRVGARRDLTAAEFIVRACREQFLRDANDRVTIIALGPITNVAAALAAAPELTTWCAGVSAMAGAFNHVGNITPLAEANVYNDPHAAAIVYGASWPVILAPLNATHRTTLGDEFFQKLTVAAPLLGKFLHDIAQFYFQFHVHETGERIIHAHDVSAIVALVAPAVFRSTVTTVTVECESTKCRGQTIADLRASTLRKPATGNATVLLDVDAPALEKLFFDRIVAFDATLKK